MLLSFYLIFCQFQSGITYKSVKKACYEKRVFFPRFALDNAKLATLISSYCVKIVDKTSGIPPAIKVILAPEIILM